jgi:hypothetical protein
MVLVVLARLDGKISRRSFEGDPTAEPAGKNRDYRTHELRHVEDITAAHPKTLNHRRPYLLLRC